MAPPTSPFSTSAQVGYLLQNLFRGQTPGASTPVTSTVITQLISWTDAVIQSRYQAVGYKMPFVTVAGETWPAHQTTFLEFMSSVGAAAMAGGYILKPAPAMSPGRVDNPKSMYAQMIDEFFAEIDRSGFHFRAQYYQRTKAEKWLAIPYGPRTDFWQDLWDPTRYVGLLGWTEIISELFSDMQQIDVDWDFLYSLRSASSN